VTTPPALAHDGRSPCGQSPPIRHTRHRTPAAGEADDEQVQPAPVAIRDGARDHRVRRLYTMDQSRTLCAGLRGERRRTRTSPAGRAPSASVSSLGPTADAQASSGGTAWRWVPYIMISTELNHAVHTGYRPRLPRSWHLAAAAECVVVTSPDGKAGLFAGAVARVYGVPLHEQPRC
jgi:hypothetical protein